MDPGPLTLQRLWWEALFFKIRKEERGSEPLGEPLWL
jgi:hypothetical protein